LSFDGAWPFLRRNEGGEGALLPRHRLFSSNHAGKGIEENSLTPHAQGSRRMAYLFVGIGEGRGIKVSENLFCRSALDLGLNSYFFSLARCPLRFNPNHTFHLR